MKQEQYDKQLILGVLFALLFSVAVFLVVNEDNREMVTDCNQLQPVTTYKEIERLKEIRDTIIETRYKKQIEYVHIIDTIYLLDSAGVVTEYKRTISSLDSLNKSGFFKQN
jgi:hypothetical protein